MRTVGGVCLEISLKTREPDPFLSELFPIDKDLLFCTKNVDTEMDQALTPQARPADTDHLHTALKVATKGSLLSGTCNL